MMRKTPMKNQDNMNFEKVVAQFDTYLYELYDELNMSLQQSEKPYEVYELTLQKALWNRIATKWSLIKRSEQQ